MGCCGTFSLTLSLRWGENSCCLQLPLLSLSGEEIRTVDEQNLQRNVTTNSAVDHVISCQLYSEAVTAIPVTGFFSLNLLKFFKCSHWNLKSNSSTEVLTDQVRAVYLAPVVYLLFRKGGFGVPNRFSFTTDQISALVTLFALIPPPRGFGGKESSSYNSRM